MTFWEALRIALDSVVPFRGIALVLVIIAVALYVAIPSERSRIKASVLFFLFSISGVIGIAVLASNGFTPDTLAYRSIRWVALLCESIAIINLVSVATFDVVLKLTRVGIPRILRDLLLASGYLIIGFILLSRSGFDLTGIV